MIPSIADGRTDRVFDYIAQGGAATDADARGTLLIAWCAYYGDVSAIRHLIAHGAALDALGANLGLNGAAFHGHWRLCQFLIENGADANQAQPDTGETPLHAATSRSGPAQSRVVRVLLASKADPNAAARAGAPTGAFMRDARTRGETPLHRAAAFADADAIQDLLDAGARRDVPDAHGDSPLSWASWHKRSPDVLRLLCFEPHRIHPDAQGSDSVTARWDGMATNLLGTPHS